MTKSLYLPVSVWLKYDHVTRRLCVRKVLLGGHEYRVRQVGPASVERRGLTRRRVFHCRTRGGMYLRLAMDAQSLRWTCEEARNAAGDSIE